MSEQTVESVAETPESLPPFSFSKKPIKSVYNSSGISSILHQQCPDQNGPTNKPSLNNINYDEQIRAPRMTSATHYTHSPGKASPQPEVPSDLLTSSDSPPSKPYEPATFDLNAPTRRNSVPLRHNSSSSLLDAYFPGQSSPQSGTSQKSESSESHASHHSQTSESTVRSDSSKIQRALLNLSENTTSAERVAHCEYAARSSRHRTNGHLVDARGPSLQHVYSLKKPLCTPAVLRPAPEPQPEEQSELDASSPESEIKEYPFQMPAHEDACLETLIEPTHDHWKPNSSSDHCTKCFDAFGNFFSPQRKRRHHCRFCGFLYCVNCLFKNKEMYSTSSTANSPSKRSGSSSSNSSGYSVFSSITASSNSSEHASGVMMDAKARLVVPIFANLNQDQNNFANMRERFKSCKICKSCGLNYLRLVQALNSRIEKAADEVTVPYAFIENPYFNSNGTDGAVPGGALDSSFSSLGSEEAAHFTTNVHNNTDRRRSSMGNNVPSDWTWSSF
ncbi:hypothetical protein FT663_03370 [Candidozyma haemuli var. vulneris]|nr:hypothetical protein FT662_02624 [[Candida] haemuloni var. vulneris]KAF3989992.1 hypothetical protein FT663_03370 [[Candida] haemuloni var. vulneris]